MGKLGGAKQGRAIVSALVAITTAGTAEALSASHKYVEWVVIQALQGNTSTLLAVGESAVVLATGRGTVLGKLNTVTLEGVYLDEVYVDVGTNGDGVAIVYKQAQV